VQKNKRGLFMANPQSVKSTDAITKVMAPKRGRTIKNPGMDLHKNI
jgi:hypothetical protein